MCWGPAFLSEVLPEPDGDDRVHVFLKGQPGALGKASAYVLGQGTFDSDTGHPASSVTEPLEYGSTFPRPRKEAG